MSDLSVKPNQADVAVIDVGSNSVRLVLYRLDGRAIWTVYNEKVLAGLGRDLATTGRLSPDGIDAALIALRRFRALLEAAEPARCFAAATAAVREASDGRSFCLRVAAETGLDLRVLSGEEEARYAAIGVIAGAPAARGMVGDLGGGSLELTVLGSTGPGEGFTLPLGPFAIAQRGRFDADTVRIATARALRETSGLPTTETLHAVGGAWRNLALLHMRITNYPLKIVHQYGISRGEVIDLARLVCRLSKSSLERIEGISRRRLETLPHAAAVLEILVDHVGARDVVMSAYGLREGLVFEAMPAADRTADPLIAGCAALGARPAIAEALGAALETWLGPAFASLEPLFGDRDPTLTAAACRLADLGAHLHPDHRADLVFDQVLRAPIGGLDHAERVFLACAAFSRHTAAAPSRDPIVIARLLSPERLQRARALGAAVRLGCELGGRSADLLAHAQLNIRPNTVVVQADAAWAPVLLGEQTAKRGATLATLLDRTLKLRSSPSDAWEAA